MLRETTPSLKRESLKNSLKSPNYRENRNRPDVKNLDIKACTIKKNLNKKNPNSNINKDINFNFSKTLKLSLKQSQENKVWRL